MRVRAETVGRGSAWTRTAGSRARSRRRCTAPRRRRRAGLQEIDEGLLQPREVVAVGLHVVGVDVGDHRDHRLQVQERGVGLVGLDDDEFARAQARIASPPLLSRPPMTKVGSSPPRRARWPPGWWWWSCRGCRQWRCPASGASARPASARAAPPGCAARAPPSLPGCRRFTAVDTTTASAPAMFAAAWPEQHRAPSSAQALRGRVSARSEPLTS